MKDITLVIRPEGDGETYLIWSPSHPHLKIVQRQPPMNYHHQAINAAMLAVNTPVLPKT